MANAGERNGWGLVHYQKEFAKEDNGHCPAEAVIAQMNNEGPPGRQCLMSHYEIINIKTRVMLVEEGTAEKKLEKVQRAYYVQGIKYHAWGEYSPEVV